MGCQRDLSWLIGGHGRRSLQGEELHPVEGVGGVVVLRRAQGDQQAVRAKVDVLAHQALVHADEVHRQRLADELLLNVHCLCYNICQPLPIQLAAGQLPGRALQLYEDVLMQVTSSTARLHAYGVCVIGPLM